MRDAISTSAASDLSTRVRESEAGQKASEAAKRTSDQTFERVGSWLVTSGAGERMGVAPAKRRRVPVWLGLLLGVAAGYLAAKLTSRSRDVTPPHDDPFAEGRRRLSVPAARSRDAADRVAPPKLLWPMPRTALPRPLSPSRPLQ